MTPLSDAQKKATAKWNKENLDRIQIVVRKGQKKIIQELANSHNESLNSYIVKAIKERAKKDNIEF